MRKKYKLFKKFYNSISIFIKIIKNEQFFNKKKNIFILAGNV